tara:strand:- start:296 stop:535 length:240 start_codon:yes stop_codon:yes gene_type:complete
MNNKATINLKVTINLAEYAKDHGDIDTDALTRPHEEIREEICNLAKHDMLLSLMVQYGGRYICKETHQSDLQEAGVDLN